MIQTKQYKQSATIIVACWQITVIGLLDYITGYELGFFVLYFIPVGFTAWASQRLSGVIASAISALTWLFVDVASGHSYSSQWYGLWNTGIRLVAFLVIAFAVSKVRELLTSERELSAQLLQTLNQVREMQRLSQVREMQEDQE